MRSDERHVPDTQQSFVSLGLYGCWQTTIPPATPLLYRQSEHFNAIPVQKFLFTARLQEKPRRLPMIEHHWTLWTSIKLRL